MRNIDSFTKYTNKTWKLNPFSSLKNKIVTDINEIQWACLVCGCTYAECECWDRAK